jgi:hypothetical protein
MSASIDLLVVGRGEPAITKTADDALRAPQSQAITTTCTVGVREFDAQR